MPEFKKDRALLAFAALLVVITAGLVWHKDVTWKEGAAFVTADERADGIERDAAHLEAGVLEQTVHVEARGAAVAGIARGAGLKFAQRSLGQLPERDD